MLVVTTNSPPGDQLVAPFGVVRRAIQILADGAAVRVEPV